METRLPNDLAKMRKLVERIRERHGEPQCCYEASSCGYVLFRSLRGLGVDCAVIAPSSMPRRPGDRIRTDRRDAHKLATMYAAGMLSTVEVPDEGQEATRAMVRCREALVQDRIRCKQRTMALLLSLGLAYRKGAPWTGRHRQWVQALELSDSSRITLETHLHQLDYLSSEISELEVRLAVEAEKEPYRRSVTALMAFRGIDLISALTLTCELGDIRRFGHPRALMAFLGLVPSERSSGDKSIRGAITKIRQRARAQDARMCGLEVCATTSNQCHLTEAPAGRPARDCEHSMEGPTPAAQAFLRVGAPQITCNSQCRRGA